MTIQYEYDNGFRAGLERGREEIEKLKVQRDHLNACVLNLQTALAAAREDYLESLKRQVANHERSLVTARAVAMEEAARTIEEIEASGADRDPVKIIRDLAPLPASLCVVERTTIEKVREALEKCRAPDDNVYQWQEVTALRAAALALLEKIK